MTNKKFPLVVILGPTAVGKTSLSIQLAKKLGGEIISADSRLFYRGMDIGTAKPTPLERAEVPHHLIDIADPDEVWSLAKFQQAVLETVQSILQNNHLPMLVGGTGQYIRAVLEGWHTPPIKPHPELRNILEQWAAEISPLELHNRLKILDPTAAKNIDYRNLRRTVRAIEVILSSGELFSKQRKRSPTPYLPLVVGLNRPRSELYDRIDARIVEMVDEGLLEEVRQLLSRGYSPDLPTLSAIGYREMVAVIHGQISIEEAITQMKRRTRIFVRRQANWFNLKDSNIHWFEMDSNTEKLVEKEIRSWFQSIRAEKTYGIELSDSRSHF